MKAFTIYDKITGEIVRNGQCTEDLYKYQAQESEGIISGEYYSKTHYVIKGNLQAKPLKPNMYCTWNILTKVWEESEEVISVALYSKEQELEKTTHDKLNLPIIYDGKELGSNIQAIREKLTELQAGMSLQKAIPLIWWDVNNTKHTWESEKVYENWLNGYLISLTERNAAIKEIYYTHKKVLASKILNTVDKITKYTV